MKPERQSPVKDIVRSFRDAFRGWWHTLKHERNAWIHLLMTLVVVATGIWLDVSRTDWALLIFAIGLVWMAEMMNTAVEAVVDLVSPDFNALAKVAKDTAAGAVLASAIAAAGMGLLVLGVPFWERLNSALF